MVDEGLNTVGEELTLDPVSVGAVPRRRALWGVLAIIALVTGAVVATSQGDGGPPRLPVSLGASASAENDRAAAASMMLAWVTYVAGDELPDLGGDAAAYRLDGAVDAGRVRALAVALGLTGEPTHDGSLWHLQSGDAMLEVYEESGGGWWYSPTMGVVSSGGSSTGGGSAGCDPAATKCESSGSGTVGPATTIPPDACANDGSACSSTPAPSECPPDGQCTTTTIVCPAGTACAAPDCPPDADCAVPAPPEPVPPADLPTKAEARKIALELLTATGTDVADAKVTVDGPYDAWYITVEPRLDGVPVSGWVSSVSVGSKGAITSASGTLGTPERLGTYPLIDTRAAIERLNEFQGGYGGGPVPMAAPYPAARDSGVATADAPMLATPCSPDDPSCAPLVDPVGPTSTGTSQCKVQPDGSEICETTSVGSVPPGGGPVECLTPSAEPGTDPAIAVPTTTCGPVGICYEQQTEPRSPAPTDGTGTTLASSPECQPPVQPEPVEIILTKAEPVLTMMPSSDGSGDVYLVPGYRFSNAEGVTVDVAAVADDSLAPTTTVPDTTDTSVVPPPTRCETVVEGDSSSGTTRTIETCPQPAEPLRLEPGQSPELGVGYYVEVNTHCGMLVFADRWWATDASTPLPWATPTEGGTFTLSSPDGGTFVGDAEGMKTAEFTARGPATDTPGCA